MYNVHSKFGIGTAADERTARAMRVAVGGHITETTESGDEPLYACPACSAVQTGFECFLGTLGTLSHFQCRYCGTGFTSETIGAKVTRGWK